MNLQAVGGKKKQQKALGTRLLFARSATSLMRSITSLRSTSFAACRNLIHLCPVK
jgi:hypothetical protein